MKTINFCQVELLLYSHDFIYKDHMTVQIIIRAKIKWKLNFHGLPVGIYENSEIRVLQKFLQVQYTEKIKLEDNCSQIQQ